MDLKDDFKGIRKIAHPKISDELLEVICLNKKPSDSQKVELEKVSKDLGQQFYPEVLFLLTFAEVENPSLAEKICSKISTHKKRMEKKLGRKVHLKVAATDYINFDKEFNLPDMINKENVISQIARKAITDNKTKAFSSEQLKHDVQKEINRTFRFGITFSIIMIDLDNFKAINDTHGHQKGDEVLEFFASLLSDNLRKLDSLYRFGGDEFLVLLPQTNINGAAKIARKLQNLLSTTVCRAINQLISSSMGITSFGNTRIKSYEKLIEAADKALYKAKKEGKNLIGMLRDGHCEILNEEGKLPEKRLDKQEKKISCQKIVPGCARGEIFVYKDILSSRVHQYEIKKKELEEELKRIQNAINDVIVDLSKMQRTVEQEINDEHGAIFLAHKLILQDSSLLNDIEDELNEKLLNGEIIVRDIFRRIEKRFLLFEDKQRREKAKDIRDIGGRVIRKLQGKDNNQLASLPENTILVSQRLLPSDTVFIDKKHVKAIITVDGSRGSHSAILARALEIPYVTVKNIKNIPNKDHAIVDSDGHSVFINPQPPIIEKYKKLIEQKVKINKNQQVPDIPLEFLGRKISLLANVSTVDEAEKAVLSGAEGVGLFRIETIYMSCNQMPDEDFLLSRFLEILNPLKGKEITIRLLDIGSDKVPSYLDLGNPINPALGLRGVRFLLKHKKLLETQLSACIRLNKEMPVKILVPMVSLPSEIRKVRNMLKKLSDEKEIPLGAVIETPAAVFNYDEILKISDFISVGTNDLIQYTMAADRENKNVAAYYDKGFQVLSQELEKLFRKADEASKDCTVCGELAGDRDYTYSMLKIGLTKFSVLPSLLPKVKQSIIKNMDVQKVSPM